MSQSETAGGQPGPSGMMESAAEFEDLDTLINMLDSDFEDDAEGSTLSPPGSSHSTSLPVQSSHSTSPPSNPSMAELGLVLSDDEDQPRASSSTSKSKFGAAFSHSKFSKSLPNEDKKPQDPKKKEVDPLEAELQQMEERVKLLKKQLGNKRKFDGEEGSSSKRFSKLTNVIPEGAKQGTSRTLSSEETSRLYSKLNIRSELHTGKGGDTDSEDEEDKRNPMEQRYNDCGREIKKRIAHESNQADDSQRERILARVKRMEQSQASIGNRMEPLSQAGKGGQNLGWEGTSGSLVSLRNGGSALPDTDKNVSVDSYSGIRIINPLVSSDMMKERMGERKMVRMSTILLHMRGGEIEGDWVTIGVLVSKSDPKTSQKGSQYSIWKLSDLNDCTKTVALFLFSGAHKSLWKSSIGSVVGILNPTIMKERRNDSFSSSDIVSLSIFDAPRAMMMGSSKDLGWCKGTTKQNARCRQFVNKASCEFCIYHIQREYQKSSSKRSDIQSSFTRVDPKRRLQEKVLGKDQVFYGGQLYTAPAPASIPKQARANKGKDQATLNSLTSLKMKLKTDQLKEEDKNSSFVLKHMSNGEISAIQGVAQKNNSFSERLLAPTPGARNLLRHMVQDDVDKKTKMGQVVSVSAKDLLNMTHQQAQTRRKQQQPGKSLPLSALGSSPPARRPVLPSPSAGPKLGRGILPGGDIDFEISPPSRKPDMAKVRAMAMLQKKGGIHAKDPNAVKNLKKAADPNFQDKVQKQLDTSLESGDEQASRTSRLTVAMAEDASRSKLGSLDVNSDKFKAMLQQKSRHTNLVDAVENEALDKYYQGLEKKEMLEDKLLSVMEIPITAYACLKCKYLAESASDFCKEENHPLKTIKTKKRFFECRNCKTRTSSLDKLPRKSCSNCSQCSWQRVAMGKVKKGPKLDSEVLSLRGDELSHYSASSSKVFLHI